MDTRQKMTCNRGACFSAITPQGGSQNVIFVASGYLTQRELYRMGALVTAFFLAVFLLVGTPWLLFLER